MTYLLGFSKAQQKLDNRASTGDKPLSGRWFMVEFDFAGRKIGLDGDGTPELPFRITGTGFNPPLAAEIEQLVVGRYFQGSPWTVIGTRVERSDGCRQLAVLSIRVAREEDLVDTEMWFDVTEAFRRD
jgi:hypothetical protein